MENNFQNKDQFEHQDDKFWNAVEIPFTESKEEIWENLESKIDFDKSKVKAVKFNWLKYSVAAVFLLLFSTTFFARFYTENISTAYAETKTHLLPDGSKIHLNVDSKLSYKPYWYRFSRSLNFEGEAFFDVAKGKKFIVNSSLGSTEVLGTSFNINSRANSYRVFCKTGLVKVCNLIDKENVLLKPNQLAHIENDKLNFLVESNENKEIAWQFENFHFEKVPLGLVFNTLEKEYNVAINFSTSLKTDYIYTGYFKKQDNAFDALETICLSLDLNVKKINEKEYSISNAH